MILVENMVIVYNAKTGVANSYITFYNCDLFTSENKLHPIISFSCKFNVI